MSPLCFALLLSPGAIPETFPPPHIQSLLKKKVVHQIKQQNQDLDVYFDEATCSVVGNYNFVEDRLEIFSVSRSVDLKFAYGDILQGRSLELSPLLEEVVGKGNIIAATQNQRAPLAEPPAITVKKWLPWVAGALALSVGGIVLYNSSRKDRGHQPPPHSRTYR